MNKPARIMMAACLGSLTGCAGSSDPSTPTVYVQATEFEQQGFKAQAHGDCKRALLYYRQALRLNRSVENMDGVAVGLINLAVLHQKLNRDGEARALIDEALSLPEIQPFIRSDAAYERARLYLREKDLAMAKRRVELALSLDKSRRAASRLNLLGRIAFLEGHDEQALQWAEAALDANRDGLHQSEQANSLRLMAEANARRGHDAVAKEHYLQALRADKEAGESAKVALDLRELGKLSLKTGNREEALSYFRRAAKVKESAGEGKDDSRNCFQPNQSAIPTP
jgi:tetratricopeptide (TPR) repeat protein